MSIYNQIGFLSCSFLKPFYVSIIIFYSTSAKSFECSPRHLFGYYLVKTNFIFEAEVIESSEKSFKINMIDVYRSTEKTRNALRIHHNYLIQDQCNCIPRNLFIPKTRYVFFIKRNANVSHQFYISEACNRFKIYGDSLFIGSSFLNGLDGIDSSRIFAENVFNDSIMPTGYKISTEDFKKVIHEVSECFVPSYVPTGATINDYRNSPFRRSGSNRKIYGYIYYPPRTSDIFTLAIISQLKEAWGL